MDKFVRVQMLGEYASYSRQKYFRVYWFEEDSIDLEFKVFNRLDHLREAR